MHFYDLMIHDVSHETLQVIIYLARVPWYFGALVFFFALFHATPHALAKWGGQSDNSKFWLNLLSRVHLLRQCPCEAMVAIRLARAAHATLSRQRLVAEFE